MCARALCFWIIFTELFEKKAAMTIHDSNLHPDDHFDSDLSVDRFLDDCHRK